MDLIKIIKKNPLPTAGVVLLGLFLISRPKKASNKDTSNIVDEELQSSTYNLTYPLSNYNNFADQLQSAMFDAGTDEDTIYNVFRKLKNPKDLLQLIKAFGIRTYYWFGWPQGNYNLAQWIQEELKQGEKDKINDILRANNINYFF